MPSGLRRPTRSDAGRVTAAGGSGKAGPERAGDSKIDLARKQRETGQQAQQLWQEKGEKEDAQKEATIQGEECGPGE